MSHEAKKKQHARTYSGLHDHYSELFTRMIGLKFWNAVAQPLLQLSFSLLQTQHFLLSTTNSWTIDYIGQPFLRTSQSMSFGARFCDDSQ